ncbi:MAG TPA: hypothetical protein DDW85_00345 [Porphyromonadaceae bacterium]|nr:hypothetical protein [Porphyromonadaceae bacterium]
MLFAGIFTNSYAQYTTKSHDKVNLYEYGGIVKSEDNLKNLFRNFPLYVENGNEIDFLSYRFIGTVKNKKEAKKYVNKNFDDLVPISWSISSHTTPERKSVMSSIRFEVQLIHETPSELRKMRETIFKEYVNLNDEVYAIKYVINLQEHIHYVFINPHTKKVQLKGNIFGIEIPISHMIHINNNAISKEEK